MYISIIAIVLTSSQLIGPIISAELIWMLSTIVKSSCGVCPLLPQRPSLWAKLETLSGAPT